MTPVLEDKTLLRAPAFVVERVPGGGIVALDPAAPNWIATDERGLRVLARLDGHTSFGEVVKRYAADAGLDVARAWLHVDTFVREALHQRFISTDGAVPVPYLGRATYLRTESLRELWIHVNDFCNLACEHCLVSSGPTHEQGQPTAVLIDAIDQAVALGVERLFFTGGEPLARPDILQLVDHIVGHHARELVILTNGTLLGGERLRALAATPSDRLRLQVSLDGSDAGTNDPIRGAGSFARVVAGVRAAIQAGIAPTLTLTILRHNLGDLDGFVRLAAGLEVRNVHLLWPHVRGRVLQSPFADLPTAEEILEAVRRVRRVAAECGVTIDNIEEFRLRLDGSPQVKNDLAGAGWTSLCLYTDGCIYPSASMAGVPDLRCGSVADASLEDIWKNSEVCRELRSATLEQKPMCRQCSLKFLCGGGDLEHGYWALSQEVRGARSERHASPGGRSGGRFLGHDPYCALYKGLAADALAEMAHEGQRALPSRSGFDRPVVYRGMGERTLHDEDTVVRTTHSACVLSEEVIDKSRQTVREFYGHAAEQPQAELCCPMQPNAEDLAHIPREVVERFYGCGSPVSLAALSPAETFVDLGSGAGIDCFIAAKKVGPRGRVYGVDMTDEMLRVASECRPRVAQALGYDVVTFKRGYLEAVPLPDAVADVVTSNCVINLSPDKPRVFREIWRLLRDHGRLVVADIVADRDVPPKLRGDGRLWGECISGALREDVFLAALERAGFYGISMLQKTFWRDVQGCRFYSMTVRGYKFEKAVGCVYSGEYAVYLGPMKAALDEEGHLFPRGVPVEVCADTAAKLSMPPYTGSFVIVEASGRAADVSRTEGECCGGPGSACC